MINFLAGNVRFHTETTISLDVGGVGYELHVGEPDNYPLLERVECYVYTALRQDEISLWGFKLKTELDLFRQLLSVNGVGLKTAQNMLTVLGEQKIKQAISDQNSEMLRVPGIGTKTAQKVIIDLQGKISYISSESGNESSGVWQEAVIAMKSLGYSEAQIQQAKLKLNTESLTGDSATVVRQLLKNIN